jgi:hypothetical protein
MAGSTKDLNTSRRLRHGGALIRCAMRPLGAHPTASSTLTAGDNASASVAKDLRSSGFVDENETMTDEKTTTSPGEPFGTLTADQVRFLTELFRFGVRFIVVGGYAVRAHGHLRPTGDLDLLVDRSEDNLVSLRHVLAAVGAVKLDEAISLLRRSNRSLVNWSDNQLLSVEGELSYQDAIDTAVGFACQSFEVLIVGKQQLVAAKRYSASRCARGDKAAQDAEDAYRLSQKGNNGA